MNQKPERIDNVEVIIVIVGSATVGIAALCLLLALLLLGIVFMEYVIQRTKRGVRLWWFIRNHFDEMQKFMKSKGITYPE